MIKSFILILGFTGKVDSYMQKIFKTIKEICIEAYENRKTGDLYLGTTHVPEAQNDRRPPFVLHDTLTRFRFVPDDGSKETAGLYEAIRISDSYVESFENWSFDDARKAGDSGIIETEYGYHIMYFVKDNTEDVDWKYSIRSTMGNEDFTAYNDSLVAEDGAYSVEKNARWIDYTANAFCDKIRKNIAYSSQNA